MVRDMRYFWLFENHLSFRNVALSFMERAFMTPFKHKNVLWDLLERRFQVNQSRYTRNGVNHLTYCICFCRILVLDNGVIFEFDTPEKLLKQESLFMKMAKAANLAWVIRNGIPAQIKEYRQDKDKKLESCPGFDVAAHYTELLLHPHWK